MGASHIVASLEDPGDALYPQAIIFFMALEKVPIIPPEPPLAETDENHSYKVVGLIMEKFVYFVVTRLSSPSMEER